MSYLSSLVGGGAGDDEANFDPADDFVPEHLPDPGPFLAGHRVLTGEEHLAVQRASDRLFEDRGVVDATFEYRLTKLNRDRRHPDAGLRYAEEKGDDEGGGDDDGVRVLRVEFVPTTPFCPQAPALTEAAARAYADGDFAADYDRVKVRLHPLHQDALRANRTAARIGPGDEEA